MDTAKDDLLSLIEGFLKSRQIRPRRFGVEALGDPRFVFDLRKGRRVWPETRAKVLAYIAGAAQ